MSKNKTIIRVRKESNFVIVSRFPLEDQRLTWEARGLYGFLLAKPDNWQILLNNLTKSSPAGYDKTKRILKELLGFKYIRKEEHRNQRGQFSYPAYTIYELPYDGYFTAVANPSTVNPPTDDADADNPIAADQRLIKKQFNKDTNKTTTTTDHELEWPDNITPDEKASIEQIIKKEDPVVVQKILGEIARQTKFTKGPVSLFCHFLKLDKKGGFTPSASDRIKAKNESKQKGEQRYQELLKQSELRAKVLFDDTGDDEDVS